MSLFVPLLIGLLPIVGKVALALLPHSHWFGSGVIRGILGAL